MFVSRIHFLLLSVAVSLSILFLAGVQIVSAQSASAACPFTWVRDLKSGMTGVDVKLLQQFLNSSTDTQITLSGPGAPGSETERFGALTAKAVSRFQEKFHADILDPQYLSAGTGRVGAATRQKLNTLCGVVAQVPAAGAGVVLGASTSAPVLIATADNSVQNSLAPANALRVPFTSINVQAVGGDVTIQKITIAKTGPVDRRAFSTVSLLDGDGYVLSYGYLDINDQVIMKDPIDVPNGETVHLVVAGDMGADTASYADQLAGLDVVAIEATTPVQATFPLTGAKHVINSTIVIGNLTASLSPDDPNGDRTRYIQDKNITFSAVRLSATSEEGVIIKSITWNQNGTVAPSDISNVATVVNGQSYPAEADGRWYTSTFTEPIKLEKGGNVEMKVVGDLGITGANRTVQFNLFWPDDIFVSGKYFGFGIYPYATDNTAVSGSSVFLTEDGTADTAARTPFFSGSVVTVSGGAVVNIGR